MSLIHSNTEECMKSELELFSIPDTQTAIRDYHYIKYYPLTSLDRQGPLEFVVGKSSENYLDLNESILFLEFSILNENGTKITKIAAGATGFDKQVVAPINAFHSSAFRGIDVYLNSKLVSQTDNLYGYKSYIQTLLTYGSDAKHTLLECGQFFNDIGDLDTFDDTDAHEQAIHVWEKRNTTKEGQDNKPPY